MNNILFAKKFHITELNNTQGMTETFLSFMQSESGFYEPNCIYNK